MAKKGQKRTDQVRQAVDEAFQAAAGQAQTRAQDIVEELAGAAGRLREALEEMRPPTADDVRALRDEVRSLAERVARLEAAQTSKPKRAPRSRAGTARGKSASS